jgi:hypothetical protein
MESSGPAAATHWANPAKHKAARENLSIDGFIDRLSASKPDWLERFFIAFHDYEKALLGRFLGHPV